MGNYEETCDIYGRVKKIHYLSGGAILVIDDSGERKYYGYRDYQGSFLAMAGADGTVFERYAYDPWGKRVKSDDWLVTDSRSSFLINRGYTGHEHIDCGDQILINMNGRVYDPYTSLFFSPDPFIQAPDNWLNYNRYAYCMNNPFKYTDPSGEFWHLIIGAIVGGVSNWAINGAELSWKGLGYFAIGALSGAIGAGIGSGVASAISGGSFLSGFANTASCNHSFINGMAIGASGGGSSGFICGAGNSWLKGEGLGKGILMGIHGMGSGGLMAGLTGGITDGIIAETQKRNFWHGGKLELDVSLNLPPTFQSGEMDCRYEVFRSNDMYFNGWTDDVASFKAKYPNVATNRGQLIDMYESRNMKLHMLGSWVKDKSSYEIAKTMAHFMEKGNPICYEFNLSGYGHAVSIRRVKVYDNGRIVLKLMNPSGFGGYTLRNTNNLLNLFYVTRL